MNEFIHVELTEYLLAWQPVRVVSRLRASNSNDCMIIPARFRGGGRDIIDLTKRIREHSRPNSHLSL